MKNGGLRILALILVALLGLSSCATHPPAPKRAYVPVVASEGALDPVRRSAYLESIAAGSDSEVVSIMLDDIMTLSETPLYTDNDVQLLIDGPATYSAMVSAIEQAEHCVFLESYIFADDEVGERFARLLMDQSRRGIDVKMIYDSFGSRQSDPDFFQEMEEAGVELIEYNAINPLKDQNPLDFNNRNHRKILVVDGRVAFTGGINFSSTYSASSGFRAKQDLQTTGWRDTHIVVEGPAAVGFHKQFVKAWKEAEPDDQLDKHLPQEFTNEGSDIVAILAAKGGDNVHSEIFEAYVSAIEAARERVWITQAYFAPDKAFMKALMNAARRGVDVRVVVPGVSDSNMVLNASRSRYKELLEAGVNVYERQNAPLHAKTAVIDGIWSTVGSSNLDYRSFLHNDEVNAIILGRTFAQEMETQFLLDVAESHRITAERWEERSLWRRVKEKLSWLVEYWI